MRAPDNRKRRRGFGPAFFFCGMLMSSACAASDYQLFGRVDAQIVSEPEPIKATLADWGNGFDSGERQWAVSQLEAGVRWPSGLELSLFSRMMADLRMNREAVAFYGKISRKEPLEPGQVVPVDVRVNGYTGNGARLGFRHRQDTWSLTGGVSLFSAGHLMSGGLNGQFIALDDSDYDFNANVDYVYYRDVIFKRPNVDEARGLGWSLDLAGTWQPEDRVTVALGAEDLFAGIRWQDVPFTRATANTEQKTYDDSGFAVFKPLISGTEGYLNSYTQELDARYKASVELREQSLSLLVRGQYQFGYALAGLGLGYRTDSVEYRGVYWPGTDSLGLELSTGTWRLALAADHLDWPDTRAVALSVSYGRSRLPF